MTFGADGCLRIGAVGLGTGSVAAYVRPGDRLTFFEIDPLVRRISTDPTNFSYTTECAKGPIDYVIGAYYFRQIINGEGISAYGPAAPNWLFPTQNPVVANAAVNGFEADSTSNPETHSYALFGQTVWHISEALSLTTGLRYTHEKKSGSFTQTQVAGLPLTGLTAAQQATAQALRNLLNPNVSYSAETSNDITTTRRALMARTLSPAALPLIVWGAWRASSG